MEEKMEKLELEEEGLMTRLWLLLLNEREKNFSLTASVDF
jgi:hypothetical protein